MADGKLWEMAPTFEGGAFGDFPPFLRCQALCADTAAFFAAETAEFDRMGVFGWIGWSFRRIGVIDDTGCDIDDPLC
jgi:hypothetical protein